MAGVPVPATIMLWAATVFPNEFRDAVGRHSLSERIQTTQPLLSIGKNEVF